MVSPVQVLTQREEISPQLSYAETESQEKEEEEATY